MTSDSSRWHASDGMMIRLAPGPAGPGHQLHALQPPGLEVLLPQADRVNRTAGIIS